MNDMPPTLTHKLIFDEAISRGWTITNLSKNSYDVTDGNGRTIHFNLSSPEVNSRAGVRTAADKTETLRSVELLGYKVAPYAEHIDGVKDRQFLEQHGLIVVKPVDGQKSQGITVGIRTPEELEAAVTKAVEYSKQGRVLLQKQLQGHEYRLLVIGNDLFAASYRRPARIVGDGKHTVAELVEQLNQARDGQESALERLDIAAVQEHVGPKVFAKVIAEGQIVQLSDLGGMSAGGETVDVTGSVHPDYAKAVLAIAKANGLVACGFDLLTEDITKPMPTFFPVLEMNAAPGFKPHAYVSEGIARNPAPALLDYLSNGAEDKGMQVTFDQTARIAGIGLVPWPRLGPERWFENYRIASYYGWDMHDVPGVPKVSALADRVRPLPELARQNTPSLLDTPEFRSMLTEELPGYSFMTYKAVQPPGELLDAGCKFLLMDQKLAGRLENKAEFRTLFAGKLPFPEYRIIERAAIHADEAGLAAILQGREAAVVQDERLSGGKGTYIVRTLDDLRNALEAFSILESGTRLVVSELVQGARERTVQCVATRYGVFVGPLQQQIVRHPLLSNLQVAEGDRFCGGVLSSNDALQSSYPAIKGYAEQIGRQLIEMGYRGIFGLDCLVGDNGNVYVIEVNPRLTGMTPLLTMMYRDGQDIPFYLLHMLELAGMDYELANAAAVTKPAEGSLLILHSQKLRPAVVTAAPQSGSYDLQGSFLTKEYRMDMETEKTQLLLQQYTSPGFKIKPGGRLATVYVNKPVLDASDQLLPEIESAITKLLNSITLEEIEL